MKHDPMAFSTHTLASGLRVFFQRRPLSFVGCTLMVHGGSRHDPEGKEELMHLLEHLLSAGTRGLPKMSLIELERWLKLRRFDVALGETHLDYSAYRGKAAAERFPDLLGFLHGLTLEPTLDSDLEKERDIIRREREEACSPEELATDDVRKRAVFGSHRLATVGGWADDATLDGLTLDDARAAHSRFYDPANMSLIAVGGIDEEELLRIAETAFPRRTPGYVPPERQPAPVFGIPDPREHVQRKEGRVTKMEVRYLWHLPPGERAPLMLARNSISETLTERIRERLRATYSVDVQDAVFQDHRLFCVVTQVAPKKVGIARAIIEETMRGVAEVAAEVPRLKDEYGLALEFLELDVDETLSRAALAINAAGAPRCVAEVRAALEATPPEKVAAVMAEHLAPERAFVELVEE
ncbi:MAG TPA: insulinase family protein [Candidatus Eisenbacteria bacterium]|jgi:predicted Zn-dependent peptidase|nr:insulinase family protein [Candidatus Eisenbacteria bacterium]